MVAVYAEEMPVDIDEQRQGRLDLEIVDGIDSTEEATIEDVINEQDKLGASHQGSLEIFEDNSEEQGQKVVKPCEYCMANIDGKFCKLECRRNPNSKSDIDLFEVIPMSQRL